jgi:hypothetical protein
VRKPEHAGYAPPSPLPGEDGSRDLELVGFLALGGTDANADDLPAVNAERSPILHDNGGDLSFANVEGDLLAHLHGR